MLSAATGGSKFNKSDIKRFICKCPGYDLLYSLLWLTSQQHYRQLVRITPSTYTIMIWSCCDKSNLLYRIGNDIAGSANYPQILLCCCVCSWFHGMTSYSVKNTILIWRCFRHLLCTEEFKVTPDRLVVYLPVVCSFNIYHISALADLCVPGTYYNPSKYLHYIPWTWHWRPHRRILWERRRCSHYHPNFVLLLILESWNWQQTGMKVKFTFILQISLDLVYVFFSELYRHRSQSWTHLLHIFGAPSVPASIMAAVLVVRGADLWKHIVRYCFTSTLRRLINFLAGYWEQATHYGRLWRTGIEFPALPCLVMLSEYSVTVRAYSPKNGTPRCILSRWRLRYVWLHWRDVVFPSLTAVAQCSLTLQRPSSSSCDRDLWRRRFLHSLMGEATEYVLSKHVVLSSRLNIHRWTVKSVKRVWPISRKRWNNVGYFD